jgi:signal transduction histidine kinase
MLFASKAADTISVSDQVMKDRLHTLMALSRDTIEHDRHQALTYALEATKLLPEIGDSSWHAEAYYVLGSSLTETGDFGPAITNFKKSAGIYLSHDKLQKYADAVNSLGVIYDHLGDYDEALRYYLASLNALDDSNPQGLVFAHNNIGLIHLAEKTYDDAKSSLLRSISIAKQHGVEECLTYPYHNLGDLFAEQMQLDSAIHYYNLSYDIDLAQKDEEGVGINLKSLGEVYAQLGLYDMAFSHLQEALDIHKSRGDEVNLSATYNSLSKLFYKTHKYEKSLAAARKALDYAEPLQLKVQVKDAAGVLSDIYKLQGDYKNALQYTEMYHAFQDSILNEAKIKELALLRLKQSETEKALLQSDNQLKKDQMDDQLVLIEKQTYLVIFISFGLILSMVILVSLTNANRERRLAYEHLANQKKQIEQIIAKLQFFNEEAEAQKKSLENSNKIKDKLISIISHDFRSPLNSLEGILDLMSGGRISNDEMKIISRDLRLKVNITTSMLDNLLNWAKNQMQGIKPTPKIFDIKNLIRETTSLVALQAENKGVKVLIEPEHSVYVYADFEMIQLVLRNLLSNAVKFTKKGDQVVIGTAWDREFLTLTVRDTGIGIPKDQLHNIFTDASASTLGTSYEKGTGLGLKLCRDFIEKNGGWISVESQEGIGSRFFFSIPLARGKNIHKVDQKNELKLHPKGVN